MPKLTPEQVQALREDGARNAQAINAAVRKMARKTCPDCQALERRVAALERRLDEMVNTARFVDPSPMGSQTY